MTPAQSRQKNGARNGLIESTATFWSCELDAVAVGSPATRSVWSFDERRRCPPRPRPGPGARPRRSRPIFAAYALSITVMLAPVS